MQSDALFGGRHQLPQLDVAEMWLPRRSIFTSSLSQNTLAIWQLPTQHHRAGRRQPVELLPPPPTILRILPDLFQYLQTISAQKFSWLTTWPSWVKLMSELRQYTWHRPCLHQLRGVTQSFVILPHSIVHCE